MLFFLCSIWLYTTRRYTLFLKIEIVLGNTCETSKTIFYSTPIEPSLFKKIQKYFPLKDLVEDDGCSDPQQPFLGQIKAGMRDPKGLRNI